MCPVSDLLRLRSIDVITPLLYKVDLPMHMLYSPFFALSFEVPSLSFQTIVRNDLQVGSMAQPVTIEPVTQGRLTIKTTAGDIDMELWPKEAAKACRNFVQLALEGYYEGCHFHRIVPGLCVQTGDASNTGEGGDSIYEEFYFEDEFSQRLRFNRRGLVAMANTGKRNTNLSQ